MKVVIYMNKKGFTLIELLGVIVLLAVIASIAFPAVQSSINTAREKTLKENKRVIVDAAKRFMVDAEGDDIYIQKLNALKDDELTGDDKIDNICLTIKFLKHSGYLTSNQDLVDPTNDNKELTGVVKVSYDYGVKGNTDNYTKRYIYEYVEEEDTPSCDTFLEN